ncbi:MAG: DUF4124 domain-containing protein [Gammaproteobacteria bacterium]|nr:DUF4124 domain-containing protein [Gammaproteobacteria bacterium]
MLRKTFISLLVFSLCVGLAWLLATEEQKHTIRDFFNNDSIRINFDLPFLPDKQFEIGNIKISNNRSELTSLTRSNTEPESNDSASCRRQPTLAVEVVPADSIYTWKDEDGTTHFSNAQPQHEQKFQIVDNYAPAQMRYFRLNIEGADKAIPGRTETRIRTDVNKIFEVLSLLVEAQHLRQVFLNVRIFQSHTHFSQYRDSIAPDLKGSNGFYS